MNSWQKAVGPPSLSTSLRASEGQSSQQSAKIQVHFKL